MINKILGPVLTTLLISSVIFTCICVGMKSCSDREIEILEQNLSASRDSLVISEMKNGDLLYEKQSYILKTEQLQEYLDINEKEIKELKKQLDSKISYISKLEAKVETGPIIIYKDSVIYKNDSIETSFDYDNKWLSFNGSTTITGNKSITNINNIYIPTPLEVGLTDDYNIFVKSKNPLLTITDIEGAIIEGSKLKPKPKRFSHGLQLGAGVGYGLIHNKFDIVVYAGYGIEFSFNKK